MPPLARTVLFTLIVPGTVVGLVPWLLVRWTSRSIDLCGDLLQIVGIGLIPVGLAVYVRCALDFARVGVGTPFPLDPPRELVARGLYRHTRNPMYMGLAVLLVGEALAFGSWAIAAYAAAFCVIWHFFVVFHEEPDLRRRFGASYERYLLEVPRWTGPLVTPWATLGGGAAGTILALAARRDLVDPSTRYFALAVARALLLLLLVVAAGALMALLARCRVRGLAIVLGCMAFVGTSIGSYLLFGEPWTARWERVAARGAPLIAAIRRYERRHGVPPPSLKALVPGYIARLPSTGKTDRDFGYWVDTRERHKGDHEPPAPSWWLSVFTYYSFGADQFMYHSTESYPEPNYERIGRWAYLHE